MIDQEDSVVFATPDQEQAWSVAVHLTPSKDNGSRAVVERTGQMTVVRQCTGKRSSETVIVP